MSRDWDKLKTFSDWSQTLHEILGDAGSAIQSGNTSDRVAVQKELNTFIMNSPNTIAGQLDDIAKKAINDIFKTAVDEALSGIAGRSAELSTLIKTINSITVEAEKAARSIRLETANKFIISSTELIRNLKDLKDSVTGADDAQALEGKIDKALKAVQDLVPSVMAINE